MLAGQVAVVAPSVKLADSSAHRHAGAGRFLGQPLISTVKLLQALGLRVHGIPVARQRVIKLIAEDRAALGLIVKDAVQLVAKIGQFHRSVGNGDHRALAEGFDTRGQFAKLPVDLGGLVDHFRVQHRTHVMRAGNRGVQGFLALADQRAELFTAGTAKDFLQEKGSPGLVETFQLAQNLGHQGRRVFQFGFQFLGGIAELLESLGTGPRAIKKELARPQVHFLETVGQGVHADPVLIGKELPFLKNGRGNTGAAGLVFQVRNLFRGAGDTLADLIQPAQSDATGHATKESAANTFQRCRDAVEGFADPAADALIFRGDLIGVLPCQPFHALRCALLLDNRPVEVFFPFGDIRL